MLHADIASRFPSCSRAQAVSVTLFCFVTMQLLQRSEQKISKMEERKNKNPHRGAGGTWSRRPECLQAVGVLWGARMIHLSKFIGRGQRKEGLLCGHGNMDTFSFDQ